MAGSGGLAVWRSKVAAALVAGWASVAGGWTSPAPVRMTSTDSLDSRVAVDSNGRLHVVYRENPGPAWQAWYNTNVGGFFGEPVQLSVGAGFWPVVACEGGEVHFAWAHDPLANNNWEIFYRRLAGGMLGPILNASNTTIKSLRPALAVGVGTGPLIAWDEALQADDRYDTFFADWNGSGFNPAINISNTPGGTAYGSVNVNLVVAPDGAVTAMWVDRDNPANQYRPNARRRVGGVWQARQEISTLALGPSTPGLAVGADGTVHTVYESGGAIWHQRFAGGVWSAPQALPGGLTAPLRCKAAVDGRGFVHVVCDDSRYGSGEIYYSTDASGAWSPWVNISNTPNTNSISADIAWGAHVLGVVWLENSDRAGGIGVFNVWHTRHDLPPPGPAGSLAGVVRRAGGAPLAGAVVCCGGREAVTGTEGTYLLEAIATGTYTAGAYRPCHLPQEVSGVQIAAGQTTSLDFTLEPIPPPPATELTATAGNTRVTLVWRHSVGAQSVGTLIRFKHGGFPEGPQDGFVVVDRPGTPGTMDTFAHTGLTNGLPYYYAAFAHDGAGAFAPPATAGPVRPAVRPDFDRDGDVDQWDFGFLQACLTGPYLPPADPQCLPADLNDDGGIDAWDVARLLGCLGAPGAAADPGCAD